MRAEEEHGGIVFETVLRAIPMVHVPIDNQDTREAILLLHIARGNRHIIEKTEAHRAPRFGMMPRRSHRAEYMLYLLVHDRIDSSQCPTGCQIGGGQ